MLGDTENAPEHTDVSEEEATILRPGSHGARALWTGPRDPGRLCDDRIQQEGCLCASGVKVNPVNPDSQTWFSPVESWAVGYVAESNWNSRREYTDRLPLSLGMASQSHSDVRAP